jgi:hypothetical protein
MPKLIITQRLEGAKNIRIVVDGQQRLRAILGYHNGDFKVSKAHNKDLSSYSFQTLPNGLDKEFLKYELGVDLLFDVPYEEILDIFARINSYTVKLEQQEIFNAKYLGYFKQAVYRTGFKYVNYFIESGVLTKSKVTRMAEAELTADLFISLIDKIQTNKGIEIFYKKYEDEADDLDEIISRFDKIMTYIGSIYQASELKNTNFNRSQLFYTLFTSIGHLIFQLNGADGSLKASISEKNVGKIRFALDSVSAKYDEIAETIDEPHHPKDFKEFINASRRGTTDTSARILRTNFLCKKIIEALS